MEEAQYQIPTLRRFAGLIGVDEIPDEAMILSFRCLLQTQGFGRQIFERVNAHLARKGQSLCVGMGPA